MVKESLGVVARTSPEPSVQLNEEVTAGGCGGDGIGLVEPERLAVVVVRVESALPVDLHHQRRDDGVGERARDGPRDIAADVHAEDADGI